MTMTITSFGNKIILFSQQIKILKYNYEHGALSFSPYGHFEII